MPSVKSVRSEIDRVDEKILELLSARAKLARSVGALKREEPGAKTVFVPEREEEVLARVREWALKLDLPESLSQAVYVQVMSLCRAAQGEVPTVHVLGPAGTHSEFAARVRFGSALKLAFHDSIGAAVKAAEKKSASGHLALVPLENSLEGTVTATLDALSLTTLSVVAEGLYSVRHALLSRAPSGAQIREVHSHPMALAQCSRWLSENIPSAKRVHAASTADAGRIAREATPGQGIAAIGNASLADGLLQVVADEIQDSADNTTRFLILGARRPSPTKQDRTSLVFSLPNRAGSLTDALRTFSRAGLNMTKIESRPHRGLQWEYLFYVDVDGHAGHGKLAKVLEKFGNEVRNFKILGSYPKGKAWN